MIHSSIRLNSNLDQNITYIERDCREEEENDLIGAFYRSFFFTFFAPHTLNIFFKATNLKKNHIFLK